MELDDRYALKDAFLLHRRNYRETSLLLDVFSRDHGILKMIAKGAMRAKRGCSSVLRPFAPLSLAWTGRGQPAVLIAVESRGKAFEFLGKTLFCGFYMNELLLRLLPAYDSHPDVFVFYEQSLRLLEEGEHMEEALRFFELQLMQALGYGLWLDRDAESGAEINPERYYLYRIEHGLVESGPTTEAIRGATLLGLREGCLQGPKEIFEAKRLMRRIINHYLGGRPLRSREMFKFCNSLESG